jgi:hypothetical protein
MGIYSIRRDPAGKTRSAREEDGIFARLAQGEARTSEAVAAISGCQGKRADPPLGTSSRDGVAGEAEQHIVAPADAFPFGINYLAFR